VQRGAKPRVVVNQAVLESPFGGSVISAQCPPRSGRGCGMSRHRCRFEAMTMPRNPRAIAPLGSALSPMTCGSACLAVSRGKRPERVLAETLRRCDARHCARLAVVLKANLGGCDADGFSASARRGTLKWPPSTRTILVSGSSIAPRSMHSLRMSRAKAPAQSVNAASGWFSSCRPKLSAPLASPRSNAAHLLR
jgi:hypothetical protein